MKISQSKKTAIEYLCHAANACHNESILFTVEDYGNESFEIEFYDAWDYLSDDECFPIIAKYAFTIYSADDNSSLTFRDEIFDEDDFDF